MIRCVLIVPAHDEEERIVDCLASILASPLPPGCEWRQWLVLDDASTDSTGARARTWAKHHRSPPLDVVRSDDRIGKGIALDRVHQRLVSEADDTAVVVVVDADVVAEPQTMAELLMPMAEEPETAIVWGAGWPEQFTCGRRASAFQLVATYELSRELGPDVARAHGRLFAYRVPALAAMRWHRELIGDDHQLAVFADDHRLRVHSAFDARVLVTPARGYTDFYTQTYRSFAAHKASVGYARNPARPPRPRQRARAAVRAFRRDPIGAVAYAFARVIVAIRHRIAPKRLFFQDIWVLAPSTKGARPADE